LEYQELVKQKIFQVYFKDYLKNPAYADNVKVDAESYNHLVNMIAESVQTRLILEELSREKTLNSIETYRLFAASQQNLKFKTVADILNTIILYGDVLRWQELNLHPMTNVLIHNTLSGSKNFFAEISTVKSEQLIYFGLNWVKSLSKRLKWCLPKINDKSTENPSDNTPAIPEEAFRYSKNKNLQISEKIPPLNKPLPPMLTEPEKLTDSITKPLEPKKKAAGLSLPNQKKEDSPLEKKLKTFVDTITQSGGQQQKWQDKRADINEQETKKFRKGDIEGVYNEGHQVEINFKEIGEVLRGEIFDSPVPLSENESEVENLIEKASPLTSLLKKQLYPNLMQTPVVENIKTNGSINPSRLVIGEFSDAIFRRYRIEEKSDKRGRPVLVLLTDGSGSMSLNQTNMLKLLTAAWFDSRSAKLPPSFSSLCLK